jgi:hypothetical protein
MNHANTKKGQSVKLSVYVRLENDRIVITSDDRDLPKALVVDGIPNSAADQRVRELLARLDKVPESLR